MKYLSIILMLFLIYSEGISRNIKDYLVAHWDFETFENSLLKDVSNNGNDLTLMGSKIIAEGHRGSCLRFNGYNYLQLNNNDYFLDNECNLTLTSWFKIEADPDARYQLFCISDNRSYYDPITFQFNDGKPHDFAFEDTQSGKYALRANSSSFTEHFKQNQWYYIAVTLCYDGEYSSVKIYIDGELKDVVSIRSGMQSYQPLTPGKLCPNYDQPMKTTIGTVYNYSPWRWLGLIDEFKIYKACLTADEIQDDYEEISSNLCDTSMFVYQSFENSDGLLLNKNAHIHNRNLGLNYDYAYSSGSAYRDRYVPVVNGFETEFAFQICNGVHSTSNEGSAPGADGFSFIIRNSDISSGGYSGGSIGYEGLENCLVIEYDMFANDSNQIVSFNDPNGNHLAVFGNKGKVSPDHNSSSHIAATKEIPIIKSDCSETYYSKIIYNQNKKTLEIFLENSQNLIAPRLIIPNFNLKDYINLHNDAKAFVGFTAATGNAYQFHNIKQWSFCPEVYDAAADVSSESEFIDFTLSPNPASESLKVSLNGVFNSDINLKIYNTAGEMVHSIDGFSGSSFVINTEFLNSGLYLLTASSKGNIFSKTFIISR